MKRNSLGLLVLTATLLLTQGPGAFAGGRTLTDAQLRALAPPALNTIPVPGPANLGDYVADPAAALVLGKALFWDMQAGSDGIQACASCHYQAGADVRSKNQLNPGSPPLFGVTPSGGGGPNDTLLPADFPFPKGLDDVVGSHGVFNRQFIGVTPGSDVDDCSPLPDDIFQVGGIKTRRVTGRNTPTAVNAVFNFRNFWDGRASSAFNGQNPFGRRDATAGIWVRQAGGGLAKVPVSLENSSLASQAVGPPMSETEMSCAGRTWPDLGRKILSLMPLAKQKVDPQDSVLASLRNPSGTGLSSSYVALIEQSFRPELRSEDPVPGGYTQMEANFSFFWGVAVQMYEATLVSDQTRFDSFAALNDAALTETEKFGLELFVAGQGLCNQCHGGPLFSNATIPVLENPATPGLMDRLVDRMTMIDFPPGIVDVGFHNIGVRNTLEDVGIGGSDGFGNPLSFASQLAVGPVVEPFPVPDPFQFTVLPGIPVQPGERTAVNGAFKAPILRNVELNGPYMHSGGHETLLQVLEFYDRQADFRNENRTDFDPDMTNIRLNPAERAAVAAFLLALTDERVRQEQAPFDHPQLFLPNGHPGDRTLVVDNNGNGEADEQMYELPAVGVSGRPAAGLPPLQAFPLVEVTIPQASGVTLAPSPASPKAPGTSVTWVAAASGGSGNYQYQFWLHNGTSWSIAKPYGATNDNTWTWDTGNPLLPAGNYVVVVWAKDANSTAEWDAYSADTPYVLGAATSPTAVTLTPSPASPKAPGTSVLWTAAASGGSTGNYKYQFWLHNGTSWSIAKPYGATNDNTWTWDTGNPLLPAGNYVVVVWAKDANSTAEWEAYSADTPYVLGEATAPTAVTLAPSPASPKASGTVVTWEAVASGGSTGNYKYQFWLHNGTSWSIAKPYGATNDNTWTWDTGNPLLPAGNYVVVVWAKEANSTAEWEAYSVDTPYVLQ